jgi:hypothetical protein
LAAGSSGTAVAGWTPGAVDRDVVTVTAAGTPAPGAPDATVTARTAFTRQKPPTPTGAAGCPAGTRAAGRTCAASTTGASHTARGKNRP